MKRGNLCILHLLYKIPDVFRCQTLFQGNSVLFFITFYTAYKFNIHIPVVKVLVHYYSGGYANKDFHCVIVTL